MQVWISSLNPYICLLINLNGYKNERFQSWYACCMGMRLNPTVFNSNSHYIQFWLLLAGHAPKHTWRCRGSNPGPFTCKANALPLSYIPNSEISGHIHWHIFTTQEVHEMQNWSSLLSIRASEITFVTSPSTATRTIQTDTWCNPWMQYISVVCICVRLYQFMDQP